MEDLDSARPVIAGNPDQASSAGVSARGDDVTGFNGLGLGLGNLWRLSSAKTRSISPENPTGEKGRAGMADPDPQGPARELGRGWKCRPFVRIAPGETCLPADIKGPGALAGMWFGGAVGRDAILRITLRHRY